MTIGFARRVRPACCGRTSDHSSANQTNKPDHQQVLPDAAEFEVFPALVAEPEPPVPSSCEMPAHSPSRLPTITTTNAANSRCVQPASQRGSSRRSVRPRNSAAAT